MKRTVGAILVIAMVLTFGCTAFAEVPHEVSAFPKIYEHGMLIGRGDGDFALNELVTRAEMAQFAVNALNLKNVEGSLYYSDMDGHWAKSAANLSHDFGATPWNEKEFQPENAVTYMEAIKVFVTVLGYAPKAEAQGPYGFVMTATSLGITEGLNFQPDAYATRADVATMLENAMNVPIMQQTGFGAYEEFQIMDGKNGMPLVTLENNFQ